MENKVCNIEQLSDSLYTNTQNYLVRLDTRQLEHRIGQFGLLIRLCTILRAHLSIPHRLICRRADIATEISMYINTGGEKLHTSEASG